MTSVVPNYDSFANNNPINGEKKEKEEKSDLKKKVDRIGKEQDI